MLGIHSTCSILHWCTKQFLQTD